jgi:hypothetical protein
MPVQQIKKLFDLCDLREKPNMNVKVVAYTCSA